MAPATSLTMVWRHGVLRVHCERLEGGCMCLVQGGALLCRIVLDARDLKLLLRLVQQFRLLLGRLFLEHARDDEEPE